MCCFGLGFSGIRFASLSYEAVMSKPGPGGAAKELGTGQALLLFFNCLWLGARDPTGVPRAEQPKVRQSPVQIFTLSSVSSHSYFPCCLLGLRTRRQVLGMWESRDVPVHIIPSIACAWALWAPSEGCRGRMAPSPAQTSNRRLCLQKGASYQGKEGRERNMTSPGVFLCNCLT